MKKALPALLTIVVFFAVSASFAMELKPEASKLYKEAENYFKSKDLKSAETSLNAALKLEPDNAVYRYILGQVQCMQHNFIEAKNNLEIVSRSRISPEKGDGYNNKLRNFKKKVKELQSKMSAEGDKSFAAYQKNINSPQKLKLAITVYKAFKLNPGLRYKNIKLLENITQIYEQALQKSFNGDEWQKEPMLQLAFLYEISNKKDKAAEVYMRALDYVEDSNEEFVITHRFDYLNRSNKEKLLDTIEAGEFTVKDFEDMLGEDASQITDEDRNKFKSLLDDASSKLENAASDEDREKVLEDIKNDFLRKQKSGEIKINDDLKKKIDNRLTNELGEDGKAQVDKYIEENKDKLK